MTLAEVMQPTSVEGVNLLVTGPLPPNPPEVLNAQSTRAIFKQLADDYDLVIVDMPPSAGLSDAAVLSTIVDGMLFVVSDSETHSRQLMVALHSLERIEAPVLGYVYNKYSASNSYYGYYYYNYYYYSNKDGSGTGKQAWHRHKKLLHQAKRESRPVKEVEHIEED